MSLLFFSSRRRHTIYWRDWSSDVCSSDLQELNKKSAELARAAADEFHTAAKPRFVAGSMGPTTKAITVTGGVTFEGLRENYYVQAKGLVEGGADLLGGELCQDTRNIKAALLSIGK